MAFSGFKITAEEVKSLGAKMKSNAEVMLDELNNITTIMNAVPDDYQGSASNEIMDKYNNLKPHFQEFKDEVDKCADLLITNAQSIAEAEEAARRAASANI